MTPDRSEPTPDMFELVRRPGGDHVVFLGQVERTERGAMRTLGYRTQSDLASAIGVSRSAVSLWLEGKVGVPRPVAMLLRMLIAAQRRVY